MEALRCEVNLHLPAVDQLRLELGTLRRHADDQLAAIRSHMNDQLFQIQQ